jgi:hypothetical protein
MLYPTTLTLSKTFDALLALTRLGIGNTCGVLPDSIDWTELKVHAEQHGLSPIVLDGIERLPEKQRPPQVFLLEWIGDVLQNYECRYKQYGKAISELATFYNRHGFQMMVLKGYACSLDWPKPEHRPTGDIDIWLFGQQKEADETLAKEKGIEIDASHHHHTVFYWGEFMVENHYDFINVHHHKSHVELEVILKELGQDDSQSIELYGEKVFLPSANLHALFLLKHLTLHFSTGEINLRQLLDWAFFVKAHGKDVDWERIESVIEQFGLKDIYGIFNAICVEELGFASGIFNFVQFNPYLKQRVEEDIMQTTLSDEAPKNVVRRVCYKYHRWKANEWKHKLCYRDSMWSAFWSGVWNHLLKPSSI